MEEELRTKSFRMYCDAMKLTLAPRLELDSFDQKRRKLLRKYAAVRASQAAEPHVDLVDQMLRKARKDLRGKRA